MLFCAISEKLYRQAFYTVAIVMICIVIVHVCNYQLSVNQWTIVGMWLQPLNLLMLRNQMSG